MDKIEKIPEDLEKKSYRYDIRSAKNGYIVTKYRDNLKEEYIFVMVIDMFKFIANSITGRSKSGQD